MSSVTGGVKPSPVGPARPPAAVSRGTQALRLSAMAGIGTSTLAIIVVTAAKHSWAVASMPPSAGPPWILDFSLSTQTVTLTLWTAGLLAGGGVLSGLAAVARGARFPLWLMIGGALVAVAALTALPPAGSTDTLDYAAYGRMVVLGHSPYVMTPSTLRELHDPIGLAAPHNWAEHVSLYGPLGTVQQWTAAALGGTSMARIVFWLKVWNALAFCAVALALDRMLRFDRARRTRAHLLWTANPLLLWNLIAGGHLDGLAAAVGFLGLALFSSPRAGSIPGPRRALCAGLLIGMAADLKISFVLFGLALAWASRRSLRTALTGVLSTLAVIVPSYLWFGPPAITALLSQSTRGSAVSFYRLFSGSSGSGQSVTLLAVPALVVMAVLLLWRLPDDVPGLPAIQPALALSLAWLFFWPYEMPWYDAMIMCLLAVYPASRLDWLIVGRLCATTVALMPGNEVFPRSAWLSDTSEVLLRYAAPGIMLGATAVLVWLCLTGAWRTQPPAARQARLLALI